MGQTLSEPVREKATDEGHDARLYYGSSCMQGWRISMEDAHTTMLKVENIEKNISFFAVYDGHGGQRVAEYCGRMLHRWITETDAFAAGDYEKAMVHGYLSTDVQLRSDPDYTNETSGCTAVSALFTDDMQLYVANAGDSRAVISVGGEALPLSYDHKPGDPEESARITNAGGFVEFGRVNGNLALSRAVGDFEFKQNRSLSDEEQIVTVKPDVKRHSVTENDEFLVLACDGIWDCLSSQKTVDYIRRGIAARMPLGVVCERIMERCLAKESDLGGVGCDNMTIMVVAILNGRTKDEWYDWMAPKTEPLGENDDDEPPLSLLQDTDAVDSADSAETADNSTGVQLFMHMLQQQAAAGNLNFRDASSADDLDQDEENATVVQIGHVHAEGHVSAPGTGDAPVHATVQKLSSDAPEPPQQWSVTESPTTETHRAEAARDEVQQKRSDEATTGAESGAQ